MQNDLEAILVILRSSSSRIRHSEFWCDEMRHCIQSTREMVRETQQMILVSDGMIERLKFIPNSYPCQRLLPSGGHGQSGASLRLPVRDLAFGLGGRDQAEIEISAA